MRVSILRRQKIQAEKTVIKPIRGWIPIDLEAIWSYRELLYFLVWRELKVRYKQTVLGVGWAVVQPFLMMVVFTLFFAKFIKVPHENMPYPMFSYAALLPWILFAEGISRSSNSLILDANLIKKVYFPRLIMPIAGVISPLIDFVFSFLIFLGMAFYFGFPPTKMLILLPVFLLLAMMTSLAVGLWFSAINAQYRDASYILPFLIQLWFFVSPVAYSSNSLPKRWELVYGLNPMAGVIEGFRWILLGTEPPNFLIIISIIIVLIILVSGAFYFRRMERIFADVI